MFAQVRGRTTRSKAHLTLGIIFLIACVWIAELVVSVKSKHVVSRFPSMGAQALVLAVALVLTVAVSRKALRILAILLLVCHMVFYLALIRMSDLGAAMDDDRSCNLMARAMPAEERPSAHGMEVDTVRGIGIGDTHAEVTWMGEFRCTWDAQPGNDYPGQAATASLWPYWWDLWQLAD